MRAFLRSFGSAALALASVLAGCGDDDAGGMTPDSSPPPPPPPMDSGPPPDAGPPRQDAGPPVGDAGGGPGTNVAGRHDVELVVEDGFRHLIVYVPERVAGDVAAPVVFMVHGTSQDGAHFYDTSGWRDVADSEGVIVVFPDALTYCFFEDENGDGDFEDSGERKVTTKWSSGFFDDSHPLCTPAQLAEVPPASRALADHPLRDDVAFFGAMIDRLSSDYVIDSRRVYATGFSNGGQMTSRLGVELPDRFAAIASHGGFLTGVEPRVPARPISFALSIGSVDDRFVTAPQAIPLDESLLDVPYFARLVADYLTLTRLEDTYTHEVQTLGPRRVSRFSYSTSTSGADNRVELVVIEGLGHVYPSFETQLWDFFSRNALP